MSTVRFHAGDKTHKAGVYANLRCSAASSHGGCGAKLVGPIRMSTKFPTLSDCLRELGRLIQQDHGPTCVAAAQELQAAEKDDADASTKRSHDEGAASLNASQVLMLHSRLKIIQARAAQASKAALEAEKQRDELHTQIEEIEEQLQPKRARSDDDAGDAHDLLAELQILKNCRNDQQRVEFHIALACVMPARETQGTNNGWIARICDTKQTAWIVLSRPPG